MIKSRVIIPLIIIGLGVNFLGGCGNNPAQKTSTQQTSAETAKSNKSQDYTDKWAELNTAFQDYKVSVNGVEGVDGFIGKLTAIDDDRASTLNTKDAKAKIGKVNYAVVALENASGITAEDKITIKPIREDIQRLIRDISYKILVPAENGLTTSKTGSIAGIQGNLGIAVEDKDGSIGSDPDGNTKTLIKQALTSNLGLLSVQIEKLSPYPTASPTPSASPTPGNEEVNQQIDALKKEIKKLKDETIYSLTLDLNALRKDLNKRRIGDIAGGVVGGLGLGVAGYFIYQNRNKRKQPQPHLPSTTSSLPPARYIPEAKYDDHSKLLEAHNLLVKDHNQLRQYIDKLSPQIKQLEQKSHYYDEEISKLNQRTQTTQNKSSSSGYSSVDHSYQTPQRSVEISSSAHSVNYNNTEVSPPIQSSPEDELVTYWNSNPKALSQYVIAEVNESTDSMNARYGGSKNPPIVEKVARGQENYWIIQWAGSPPYLVPKDTITVNEFNIETISVLFVPHGYHQDYQKITLRKPALVSAIANEQWKLEEPGELQFD